MLETRWPFVIFSNQQHTYVGQHCIDVVPSHHCALPQLETSYTIDTLRMCNARGRGNAKAHMKIKISSEGVTAVYKKISELPAIYVVYWCYHTGSCRPR